MPGHESLELSQQLRLFVFGLLLTRLGLAMIDRGVLVRGQRASHAGQVEAALPGVDADAPPKCLPVGCERLLALPERLVGAVVYLFWCEQRMPVRPTS